MRARLGLAAIALLVAVPACTEPFACTLEARSGVTVDVSDRVTGDPITTATVTLREGDYVEVIAPEDGWDGQYSGAWERAGTYQVTVEAPGYVPVTLDGVVVEDGGCHVEGTTRTVRLGM